jgi:hypothetical protein
MKRIILFLFCLASLATAQDFEPGQIRFFMGQPDSVYLSSSLPYFTQTKMIMGWQWGAERVMQEAMNSTQTHSNYLARDSFFKNNVGIISITGVNTHSVRGEIMNARAIQYEPTLLLDPNNPDKLIKRTGDTTRPVFGFLKRRGRIETNPSNANFNRLIIDSNALQNQVILEEPWPSNQMKY